MNLERDEGRYPDVLPLTFLDIDGVTQDPELMPDGDGLTSATRHRLVIVADFQGVTQRLLFTIEDSREVHQRLGEMLTIFDEEFS
jgi:hypothetical protein